MHNTAKTGKNVRLWVQKKVYDKVRKDIFVRVFDLREGNTRVIFVYGDLLWWNTEFVDKMKKIIANVENIPQENIIFTASHNHSGPGTGKTFIPLLETADEEYVKYLVNKGINPPVWRSGNCPGGDEWNNQFIGRFKDRITCL